ncbi:hypothetical protein CJF31_00005644 [Rutstroemia sp. NJR-2017a BVV2]|nr:hypothetical protein CJF31_00005644 [Rutstroemia sp. NJR-2017a BVV2]
MNQSYTLWSADDGSVAVELMGNVGEDDPHIATTLSPSKFFDQETGELRSVGFVPSPSPGLGGIEDASDNPVEIHTPCRTLFVNIINGNTESPPICLAVSPLYSIANIKSMIHDVLSIAPDQQALFYAEEQLDDNESLEACQIEDEATINAIVWQVDDTSRKETGSLVQETRSVVTPHMDEPEYTEKIGTERTRSKNSRTFAERDISVGPLNGVSADPVELNPSSMRVLKRSSTSFPENLVPVRKRKSSTLRHAPDNIQQSSWEHIRGNDPLRGSQLNSNHDEFTEGFLSRKDRPPPNFGRHRHELPSRIHKSVKSPGTSRGDPTHGFPMDKLRSSPDYIDRRITSPTPARLGGASLRDDPTYETGDYPGYDFVRDETRSSPDYIPSFSCPPSEKQTFPPSSDQAMPDYIPTFETQRRMLQDNMLGAPRTETNNGPFAPTHPNYFPEYTPNVTPSSSMSTSNSSRNPCLPRKKSVTLPSLWSILNANDSVAQSSFANGLSAQVSQQLPSRRLLSSSDFTHEDDRYPSRHTQRYASRLSETPIYSDCTSSVASTSTLPPLAQDILPPNLLGARTVQQLIELQGWEMSAQEWRQVRNALEGDGEAQRNIQVLSAKLAGHGHMNNPSHGRD